MVKRNLGDIFQFLNLRERIQKNGKRMLPLVLDWHHIAMTLIGQILLLSNNISGASNETHLIL